MNKKEIAEIKRQFKFGNENITIFGFGTYQVRNFDVVASKFLKFADMEEFEGGFSPANCWNELEEVCMLEIVKKTLSGSIGKALTEYTFPLEVVTDDNSNYQQLYSTLENFTPENIEKYAKLLANKISCDTEYVIVISKSSYVVPQKDVNGEKVDMEFSDGDTHEFMTVSICPLENSKPMLMVESTDVKHTPIQRQISLPIQGFTFPTFNERATDVNSVLVFNKKPKEPCTTLIEDCLECQYILSPEEEQIKFNNLVSKIVDKDTVDCNVAKNIHENISSLIENTSVNTELTELNKTDIRRVLVKSGISDDDLSDFDKIYEEEIGVRSLKAVNLVENDKMNIKSPDITINAKNNSLDRIDSKVIDGHKCIVIEFDENVEINGMKVEI